MHEQDGWQLGIPFCFTPMTVGVRLQTAVAVTMEHRVFNSSPAITHLFPTARRSPEVVYPRLVVLVASHQTKLASLSSQLIPHRAHVRQLGAEDLGHFIASAVPRRDVAQHRPGEALCMHILMVLAPALVEADVWNVRRGQAALICIQIGWACERRAGCLARSAWATSCIACHDRRSPPQTMIQGGKMLYMQYAWFDIFFNRIYTRPAALNNLQVRRPVHTTFSAHTCRLWAQRSRSGRSSSCGLGIDCY